MRGGVGDAVGTHAGDGGCVHGACGRFQEGVVHYGHRDASVRHGAFARAHGGAHAAAGVLWACVRASHGVLGHHSEAPYPTLVLEGDRRRKTNRTCDGGGACHHCHHRGRACCAPGCWYGAQRVGPEGRSRVPGGGARNGRNGQGDRAGYGSASGGCGRALVVLQQLATTRTGQWEGCRVAAPMVAAATALGGVSRVHSAAYNGNRECSTGCGTGGHGETDRRGIAFGGEIFFFAGAGHGGVGHLHRNDKGQRVVGEKSVV
mmetsp:Transcript_14539/g.28756  ORF Transcript_14539/g.28756 Transcript_14539/m.28756 type:complete len:261 (-) Transcript_14539:247-1029(-)